MNKPILIPYYKGNLKLNIDTHRIKAVISPNNHELKRSTDETEIVRDSLNHPVGTKKLSDLSKNKKKVTVITSDHTRAVPSSITLPLILEEIRKGNPSAEITIIIATGLHRQTTEPEMRQLFGNNIVDKETIIVNDANNDDDFIYISDLPSGAGFSVNKAAVECDLLVSEGFIEPHFFAGFSGGRKSVLPGICSRETINENHSFKAIAHVNAASGVIEGNPIHEDMIAAARKVNLQFILNVALDENKKITAAFAGDMEEAHNEGIKFVRRICERKAIKGDIIVTGNGGYPLDQNLYQSVKAVSTAEICAKKDAIIIMCCSCVDGIGGDNFGQIMTGGTPEEMMIELSKIPPKETIPEQWNAQIYFKVLSKYKVIIVSEFIEADTIIKSNMIPAATLDEAMEKAIKIKGEDAEIVVIPDGVAVIISE